MIAISLRKAIEYTATNNPKMLKSRKVIKVFLTEICWRCIRKHKCPKEDWPKYIEIINLLMEEFCHE